MDRDKLRTVVEAIPPGRWMSYADVCVAAGGFADEARSVNQRLIQLEVRRSASRAARRRRASRRRRWAIPNARVPSSTQEGVAFDGAATARARTRACRWSRAPPYDGAARR